MAARSDTRGPWTVVQDSGNHPRIQRPLRVPRKPTRNPSTSKSGSRGFDRQNLLVDITRRLEVIGAIAKCLRHGVTAARSTQIERIGRLCTCTRKSYMEGEVS